MGQTLTTNATSNTICTGDNFNITMSFNQTITFILDYNLNDGTGWTPYTTLASTSSATNPSLRTFFGISLPIVSNPRTVDFRIRYSLGGTFNAGTATTTGILLSINENPLPSATVVSPIPSTICNGTSVNIGASPVTGNTYSWTSNVGTFSSTNSNPSVTPSLTQTYTLTETISATGCFNSNQVIITVNNVTSGTISGTQAICVSGDPIELTSVLDGTGDGALTYKWEFRPNGQIVWTVDPALLLNQYDPPSGLTTTTDYRRYSISTLNSITCTSLPTNEIKITVNPTPNVDAVANQIKCNGINSDVINFTSSVSGATFSWTNNLSSIGILGSGNGSSIASTQLTNTSTSPSIATFNVTPSANSCAGPSGTFTITVNPSPNVLIDVPTQIKCNGINSDVINFTSSVSGATFSWTNNLSSIGILGSGNGSSIASTQLTNTSTSPSIATFNVTPSANSCPGPSGTFSITVNPTPNVDAVANQIKCNGINSDAINFTSSVTGSTFTWTNNLSSIGIAPSGSGNISATLLTNSSTSPAIATFNITPTANSCPGPSGTFSVTVNPSPIVTATSNPLDGLICAGSNITLNGGGANTYTWSGNVTNGIAFAPTTSTTYTVTGTDGNGCTNTATKSVTVRQLPSAPISNPSVIVYDGVSHNGLFQIGTGEDIFWYAAATGASTSVLPTQTTVGKKEAYAEAKLNVAPFCISATRSLVSVEITPAPLTVKNITGANKPYDGNTVATVNGTPAYDGLVAADAGFTTVQGGPSFNFDTKDAGTNKPITVTGYTAPSTNYTLTQPTGLTANITPAPLTIAGISGANKVYDRNTTASVTGSPIYIGLVAGENLNVVGTPTYSFANKNVGIAKSITVSGFTAPNGNYTLSAQPTGITADITLKLLTVTGTVPVRVYDATTNTPGLTLDNNRISGDIVNVSRTSAAFENPNAGVNKNILLTGVSIFPGDDGENYYLASNTATVKGTITPLPININANDAIKTETDPDPVFTYTHSPALYTPEVFTGALSRIPGETPADYPLTIGSLSAGNNYILNLNAAKLTIKPLVTNYIFEVPNAFTPNLDGTNDLLNIIKNYRVTGLNYFRIYNRTGQLVFETNNLAQGWNGRRMGDMSGNVLEADLYVWIAEFTTMNDPGPVKKTGSVLLLK